MLAGKIASLGTAAPTHSAAEGTFHWDKTANKLYVNNNGSTGWTEIGAGGGGSDIGCRVRHSVNQSIPDNTTTALNFDTEDYDTDTMHDTVTNNTRITIKTAGKYLMIGRIQMGNTSTVIQLQIRLNGTTVIAGFRIGASNAGDWALETCSIYNFAVNDYVELTIIHTTGGARDSIGGYPAIPNFMAQKIDKGG